jgi:hypothetical protein
MLSRRRPHGRGHHRQCSALGFLRTLQPWRRLARHHRERKAYTEGRTLTAANSLAPFFLTSGAPGQWPALSLDDAAHPCPRCGRGHVLTTPSVDRAYATMNDSAVGRLRVSSSMFQGLRCQVHSTWGLLRSFAFACPLSLRLARALVVPSGAGLWPARLNNTARADAT